MVVANKLDTLLERELNPFGVTAKQWFLTAIVETAFERPPTIKEAAKAMGSSHQNVKQVALKLKEKGFMKMEKDSKDGRVTRLSLTEQSRKFWGAMDKTSDIFIREVFKDIDMDNIADLRKGFEKVSMNVFRMENAEDDSGA